MNIKETFRVIEVNIKILQNKPNSSTRLKTFKLHFLENEVSNEKQNSILYLRLISPPRIMVPTWSYHPVTRHPVYTNREMHTYSKGLVASVISNCLVIREARQMTRRSPEEIQIVVYLSRLRDSPRTRRDTCVRARNPVALLQEFAVDRDRGDKRRSQAESGKK